MRATFLSVLALMAFGAAPAQQSNAAPAPAAGPAQQADPLPTIEQIRKRIEAGDGADALKHVNRLLSLRGKAAEAYSKHELLSLKGEAHLRLRANEAAAAAFRQAASEADDPQQKAVARATELLIRRSKNLGFTPNKVAKGGKAEPIDIVEAESRHKALSALFV